MKGKFIVKESELVVYGVPKFLIILSIPVLECIL